jgi:polyisoprenoid-binding protein YceI
MASISAPASLTTWKIDPAHTVAEFKVKHMMIANVKGTINRPSISRRISSGPRLIPTGETPSCEEVKVDVTVSSTGFSGSTYANERPTEVEI